MNELIQSAMEAASRGDKNTALGLINQACDVNPNDTDALLVLATLVDEPTRKRQILNRVFSLDPTNKAAREMLLEMDRAEISAYASKPRVPSASAAQSQPGVSGTTKSNPSTRSLAISLEKPLVFRFSPAWPTVLYSFTTLACCATLFVGSMNVANSFPFFGMAIILGLGIWTVSSRVEVSESGLRSSYPLTSSEMKWNEIASMKINPLRSNLELISNIGESLTISTHIKDYRILREILEQKRPDLFPPAAYTPVVTTAPVPESQPSIPISHGSPEFVSAPIPEKTPRVEAAAATTIAAPKPVAEKPLIFRTSSVSLTLFYVLMSLSLCTGFLVASQNVSKSLPSFGLALLFGLTAFSYTSKVEVRNAGIRASSLLGGTEINWNEISGMKSNSFKRKLELTSSDGKSVNISTQIKGYPIFIEILRQRRPDLFAEAASPVAGNTSPTPIEESPSMGRGISVPALEITASRTFQKSLFKQYGLLFGVAPVFLIMIWFGMMTEGQMRTTAFISAAFCILVMILPFFQVNAVKVEPDKLTIETFFEEKEFGVSQIKEIKMQSVSGRYGRVTNFINIIPVEGKKYPLGGFSDGDEIVYGYLMNWWNTHQNR